VSLIVVTKDGNLGPALVAALDIDESNVRIAPSVEMAALTCAPGSSRWLILDSERVDAKFLADVRTARNSGFPRIAGLLRERSKDWEEKAIVDGVSHFFERPIKGVVWRAVIFGHAGSAPPFAARAEPSRSPFPEGQLRRDSAMTAMLEYTQLIREVVSGELLDSFMERLRRILGATKCLLFLKNDEADVWLTCAYRAGVSGEIAANIRISMNEGLGNLVRRKGGIVRRSAAQQEGAEDALGEMAVLEAEYAIPVHDKEDVRGILLLGNSVVGEPLSEDSLQVIYHLLEELASALRIRKQIEDGRTKTELQKGMLDASGEAIIAVDDTLAICYCNKKAQATLFGNAEAPQSFHTLPKELASAIYGRLKGKREHASGKVQLPFSHGEHVFATYALPGPVVVAKLWDPSDGIEIGAGGDAQRLLRRLGRQLSNELRNSLTSIMTCSQLLAQNDGVPEDLKGMGKVMQNDVQRLSRLAENLFILSRPRLDIGDAARISDVVAGAWERAQASARQPGMSLEKTGDGAAMSIHCDRKALEAGLSELFLNAIQAASKEGDQAIHCSIRNHDGMVSLLIRGSGYWSEDQRVGEPFYSSKAVGVGLGIAVAKKVIADHGGRLTLKSEKGVEIELPSEDE
jgi:signal transduction histidine kinase